MHPDVSKCPANATQFEGVEIEYITDEKYLFPEKSAPKQAVLGETE